MLAGKGEQVVIKLLVTDSGAIFYLNTIFKCIVNKINL